MGLVTLRARLAVALFLLVSVLGPAALTAQQRPSSQQAAQLLRTRPDLVAMLRRRVLESGLTREQIQARLVAEGYPADLLDPYLPGVVGTATEPDGGRRDSILIAAQSLGLSQDSDLASFGLACEQRDPSDTTAAGRAKRVCVPRSVNDSLARQAEADSGRAIFGLDIFQAPTTLFDANLGGPVDPNYRFGPADKLTLILTGDVEQAYSLEVSREGYILVPQVGQIFVANLTLGELQSLLRSRLSRSYSGIDSGTLRFSVSVTGLRSVQVYVLGDVRRPGAYRVSSLGTALTALYAAGGPTRTGSLRRITIRRGRAVVDTLDVYDYLLRGDAAHDPRLANGDVVFVPVHGARVRVVGEIVRPATYELKPGESLATVLAAAGGFTERAARRRVLVERIVPPTQRNTPGNDRIVLDVASEDLSSGFGPPLTLQPGDIVRVFAIAERVSRRIAVRGNVWQPGSQGFIPGMALSQALRAAGGIKPDAYLGRVLITRLNFDSTRVQLRAELRDTVGTPVVDVPLREDDDIEVFSTREFRPERFVAVSGAVRRAGRFPYREGMTVRDLVLLAGGVLEGAYLSEAEVARLPENRANGVTATTVRIPLDSSYLFERGPDGKYMGPPGLPAPRGPSPEVVLDPYDNVLILRQPDFQLQRSVVITGEVRFPGRYTLKSRTERLINLIDRAGGVTGDAYPKGVVFFRHQENVGRIGINLQKALTNPRLRDNLILQDADSIHVPQYRSTVAVTGYVNAPVSVAYVPGLSIDYYIAAAGGPNTSGDAKRAYVVLANGKVESAQRLPLLPDLKPKPDGGSKVVVPLRNPADRVDYFSLVATVASTLTSAVTAFLLIRSLR